MKKYISQFLIVSKKILIVLGGLFICILLFSFTTGPYWIYHWLGMSESEYHFKPKNIIIMGGAGMPSESALMRLYFASNLGNRFPESKIYITQPAARGVPLLKTDAYKMKIEMVLHGIDSSRIFLEINGKNTREEALNVIKLNAQTINEPCVIVTAPEHMLRSILSFRKAGFKMIGGEATFNEAGPSDLLYHDGTLGGNKIPLPEVGESLQLRYQFWNHLRYQVICYRELFGLLWYKIRGWA
jgi:uncharacterized SAM-binding protein YcdF (DUF218 family)